MAEAIAELRGELATKGTYSADLVLNAQAAPKTAPRRPRRRLSIAISSTDWGVPCLTNRRRSNGNSFDDSRHVPT